MKTDDAPRRGLAFVRFSQEPYMRLFATFDRLNSLAYSIRVAEVAREAVRDNAAAIVAHNHPSSNLTFPLADVKATEQIVCADQTLLDIKHPLIIGRWQHISPKARGLGVSSWAKYVRPCLSS